MAGEIENANRPFGCGMETTLECEHRVREPCGSQIQLGRDGPGGGGPFKSRTAKRSGDLARVDLRVRQLVQPL